MEMLPVDLCYMTQIENIRNKYHHQSASHAFASLFIWKKEQCLSIYLEDEMFAVKYGAKGENAWFFPCGQEDATIRFIDNKKNEQNFKLYYMRNEDVLLLNTYFSDDFFIEERPEDHEYLYDRSEQTALSGRRFSQLRNHINRVSKDHTLTTVAFGNDHKEEAMDIINSWGKMKALEAPGESTDEDAAEILLKNARTLNVSGVLIYVDYEPYAMVAGYALGPDSFDICLAKQKDYLSGLSVYAKHEFILSLPPQYTILNAEEDLGIEGLRMMKRQMKPSGMIEMYEASIR